MLTLDIDLDDIPNKKWNLALMPDGVTMPQHGVLTRIGLLNAGMESGRHTVSMVIKLDNGIIIFAEQSWRNFSLAAVALIAKWGTP